MNNIVSPRHQAQGQTGNTIAVILEKRLTCRSVFQNNEAVVIYAEFCPLLPVLQMTSMVL